MEARQLAAHWPDLTINYREWVTTPRRLEAK